MVDVRRIRGPLLCLISAVLICFSACSRPLGGDDSDQGTTAPVAQPQAPFHQTGETSESGQLADNLQGRGSSDQLPFQDSRDLPAGTLVTVELKNSIYAGNPISSGSFEAVVVQPVVVKGNTLIPAGATAEGRVEAAQASKVRPSRGYVRLALESVQVGGSDIPVQTASLFARQSTPNDQSPIHLEKGRRLTFRFTEPVYSFNQKTQVAR
jgi:hypothetical protein